MKKHHSNFSPQWILFFKKIYEPFLKKYELSPQNEGVYQKSSFVKPFEMICKALKIYLEVHTTNSNYIFYSIFHKSNIYGNGNSSPGLLTTVLHCLEIFYMALFTLTLDIQKLLSFYSDKTQRKFCNFE